MMLWRWLLCLIVVVVMGAVMAALVLALSVGTTIGSMVVMVAVVVVMAVSIAWPAASSWRVAVVRVGVCRLYYGPRRLRREVAKVAWLCLVGCPHGLWCCLLGSICRCRCRCCAWVGVCVAQWRW